MVQADQGCVNCRHWQRELYPPDDYRQEMRPCDLTTFENYDHIKYPESLAICTCWNRWAYLLTAPSFGCVQWERQSPEETL